MSTEYLHCTPTYDQEKPDTPRYLVTLDVGIGDAVVIGLSAVDQIVTNDPSAVGAIDVLCSEVQAQLFEADPRINRIITTSKVFFPGPHITQWLRGITLDPEAAHVVHFLQQRDYEAIFPSTVAPGLYFRLHARLMYPQLRTMIQNIAAFRRQDDIPVNTIARHMVNHYFKKDPRKIRPSTLLDKPIPLYLSSEHTQKARHIIATLKAASSIDEHEYKLLIIAPDTSSEITRPPSDLLLTAISSILATCPQLIVSILPSYTETMLSPYLQRTLSQHYPRRVFLMPDSPKMHLLLTTALIDQANIFVTGDTGVMHLAAAQKKLREDDDPYFMPSNDVKIVALFGGTSPAYFGYSKRSTIIGRGRKEQAAYRPGFSKESYDLRGRNIFDHITPQHITSALLEELLL